MAVLPVYREVLGVRTLEELCARFVSTLLRTNRTHGFFVDWQKVQQKIEAVHLNGHPVKRLPNTLNLSFEMIEGESAVINLDLHGIAASAGSACTSGALEPSHVLMAMGIPTLSAQGSLRFSLGRGTTKKEMDETVEVLTETVSRLRSMSPFYADMKKSED